MIEEFDKIRRKLEEVFCTPILEFSIGGLEKNIGYGGQTGFKQNLAY